MTNNINFSFGSMKAGITDYFVNLDQYEQYANIAMLVGLLLIIYAVIIW